MNNFLPKSPKLCQFCCKLWQNLSNSVKLCRKPLHLFLQGFDKNKRQEKVRILNENLEQKSYFQAWVLAEKQHRKNYRTNWAYLIDRVLEEFTTVYHSLAELNNIWHRVGQRKWWTLTENYLHKWSFPSRKPIYEFRCPELRVTFDIALKVADIFGRGAGWVQGSRNCEFPMHPLKCN